GWIGRALPAIFVALIGFAVTSTALKPSGLEWVRFSETALAEKTAKRSPSLIEFTADWCLNCKVLEKTVFADPSVVRKIAKLGVTPFLLNMTTYDETEQRVLERYGGTSLPYA